MGGELRITHHLAKLKAIEDEISAKAALVMKAN
jgi:hypothetical protein